MDWAAGIAALWRTVCSASGSVLISLNSVLKMESRHPATPLLPAPVLCCFRGLVFLGVNVWCTFAVRGYAVPCDGLSFCVKYHDV